MSKCVVCKLSQKKLFIIICTPRSVEISGEQRYRCIFLPSREGGGGGINFYFLAGGGGINCTYETFPLLPSL